VRVAWIAPFGLRAKGTVRARTLPLARALAARGVESRVLVPPWDSPQDAGRAWEDGGVQVVNVALGGGVPATVARLIRGALDFQPDVVHIVKPRAHAGLAQWALRQARPALRRPCALVLDVDDWEQAWAEVNHYATPVARFLVWQEEWGIRHADAVTAASRWLAERVQVYAPAAPVLYLPNGVDARLLEREPPPAPLEPPGPPTVLYFTRFVEVSPAWLVDFTRALYAQMPGVRLVVAGESLRPEGDYDFRAACAALDGTAAHPPVWLGGVAPESVPGLYAAATCAIYPAADVPLQQAKCSVRLATTLLHGVTVVASAVGEQAHYGAEGAARLVPPGASPTEFAAAVAGLLRDPDARAAMLIRARARLAAHYRWDDLAARLHGFYGRLIHK
jgi:glycosyltransferase involved in cell wall biosynthesis